MRETRRILRDRALTQVERLRVRGDAPDPVFDGVREPDLVFADLGGESGGAVCLDHEVAGACLGRRPGDVRTVRECAGERAGPCGVRSRDGRRFRGALRHGVLGGVPGELLGVERNERECARRDHEECAHGA